MQFLYDNLTATVVSMTVLLVLVSIQMRATSTSVSKTARNAAVNQAKSLAEWIEEDVEGMGRNIEDGETVFEDPTTSPTKYTNDNSPTGATLGGLTFYYREKEGGALTTIDYTINEADTSTIEGEQRTLYELNRHQDGSLDGGSSATLGYFDVQFLGRNAGEVTDPVNNKDEIQSIRVVFSVVVPFQGDESSLQEFHRMVVVPYTPAHG